MKVQSVNSNFYQTKKTPSFKRAWQEHISWGANYVKETGKTNFKLFTFPDAKAVFVEVANKLSGNMGKIKERLVSVLAAGGAGAVISSIDEKSEIYPMKNQGKGVFTAENIDAKPEDSYRYIILTQDENVNIVKDPYAKKQENILGWSSVYNQDGYEWQNTDWLEGKDPRRIVRKPNEPLRGLENLVIEEINIPTLSEEGTFDAAKSHVDTIAERGIANAIEIMPVENTFSKQWGYDGVDKFAVNTNLGGPDKLKDFIDYAHGKGLNVIMDMVPNHMGPDGDFLKETGPYIKAEGKFGNLLNYEGNDNRYVRDWMANAALWWANEYKVDGIRFDLTHATGSDYLLKQISLELNEHNPDVFLIAEDNMDNREQITKYHDNVNATHNEKIEFIDSQIDLLQKGWGPSIAGIGYDSEWDSKFKDMASQAVLEPGSNLLGNVERNIKDTRHRVKYAYSHDEIGNWDGTRFVAKNMVMHFMLSNYVDDDGNYDDKDRNSVRGQKAANASQKLCELIVSKDFDKISRADLMKYEEKECGLKRFISKDELINVFKAGLAKQKLLFGLSMTTPGPKMYFQGDDQADLSLFRFFREFSDSRDKRANDPNELPKMWAEKGYDTLEEITRPDCIVGKIKYDGMFKDTPAQMIKFNKDLSNLLKNHSALQKGEITAFYNDYNHNVNVHKLTSPDEELLVIKHFGNGFIDKSYEYFGFPQDSTWEEIFNSDAEEYGGAGYTNEDRKDITNLNQKLSLAPNSFIILKRIS